MLDSNAVMKANEIMKVRLCIDTTDVQRVADFWVSAFGYTARDTGATDDWRHLDSSSTALPPLTIQPVPEAKTVKNRLHLDIFVSEPEPWIQRCVSSGATKLWVGDEPDDWYQVMADPGGNEFCICLQPLPPP